MRKIIHMKALILDTMVCIFCRVYHHMLLCCVQHVGHTKALQVGDVAHRLTIPNDYSGIYLVTADRSSFLLLLPSPNRSPASLEEVLVSILIVTTGKRRVSVRISVLVRVSVRVSLLV